jgi:putative oxidoreductase
MFPHLAQYTDYGLLFMRCMAGLVFADSGYRDLKEPRARAESVGLPTPVTIFIGVAELLGGIAIIIGLWPQLAGAGLILIMLGALQKKIFVWKTGFWGKDGLGWNYELILVSMLLVILFTDGGRLVVLR